MIRVEQNAILLPQYANRSNGESDRAKALFASFLSGSFCYEDIAGHPDYLVYASADTLAVILPLIIQEMISRNDSDNYLIYPMISAIDPDPRQKSTIYQERTQKLIVLATLSVIEDICRFLGYIKPHAPVPLEQLDRLASFWLSRRFVT